MVQRKVPNKLGIQADHVKSEKRLGNLKPSSCQHQDGKNRGPDMKKKMKRSRSIKISDIESLKSSSPLRKAISQPGEPPPLNDTTTAAAPQKQFMIKTTDGSPNYMKSTSSSEARKERSPVSPLNTQTGSNGKNLHYRNSGNSRFSPASGSKPARTLSKTSSLKLVRTPSFKPTRGTAKKCSRVALCADVSTQKATCSSTQKDSKFPAYLMLNPGGTEAEGTSVMKVCPYTHCSLNGHQHKPVTPLRCFLKARRRSLKVQNSMKLEDLSPRRARPSGDGTEEIHGGLLDFSEDKPVIQEVGKDFFIEIYANNTEYGAYETEKRTENEGKTADAFLGEPEGQMNESCFYAGHEAAVEQDNNNHLSESSSDESQESEIDFEENFEEDDNISEETGMVWEEDQHSTSEIGAEDDDLNKHDKFWTKVGFTPEIEKLDWSEDSEIITSDDVVSNCTEEILADEVLREFFSEETASIDMQCSNSDSESYIIPHYWQILQSIQVAGNLAFDQPSAAEDAFEAPKTEEKDEEAGRDLRDAVTTSAPIRESIVEPIGARENIQENNETDKSLGDGENGCTADISAEALKGHQEDKSLQAENAAIRPHISEKRDMIGTNKEDEIDQLIEVAENNQEFATAGFPDGEAGDATEDREQVSNAELQFEIHVSDSPQDFSEADQDDAADGNHMTTSEEDSSSQDLVDATTPTEPLDHQLDEQDETNHVLENENLFEEDKDEAKKIEILTAMDFESPSNSRTHEINSAGDDTGEVEKTEVEVCNKSDTAETFLSANNGATSTGSKRPFVYTRGNPNQELQYTCNTRKWTIGEKKPIKDLEEEREFNPREPNFLPVVPDPEAEKVDLRHQMMDDRKNSEEWMLDYALRQAVTKLAPARKRKVALLVEAFEKVLPTPKYETHIRHTSATFSHTRPIQACS